MPRHMRSLEKIERAGHVDVDKFLGRVPGNIGFVQRATVDDGFNSLLGKRAFNKRAIGDRAEDLRSMPGATSRPTTV